MRLVHDCTMTTNDLLHNVRIKHQSGDVLSRHARELVREDGLEPQHPEVVLGRRLHLQGVVEDLEPQDPLPLFLFGGVVTRHLVIEESRLCSVHAVCTYTCTCTCMHCTYTHYWMAITNCTCFTCFTSGPTIALGSVIVATISPATSDTSRPRTQQQQ